MTINRVISKLRFAAIICAIAAQITNFSATQASATPLTPSQHALYGIITKFIDTKQDATKPLSVWAHEIITIINTDPEAARYQPFCAQLNATVEKKERNVTRFAMAFKDFQGLLPAPLKANLEQLAREKNLNLKAMIEICSKRLAVQ